MVTLKLITRACPRTAQRMLATGWLLVVPLTAGDWPAWRGPNRDGISQEKNWLVQWPDTGPKQLWKADVGVGLSSMSVSQGHLYTIGNTDETDSVYCLDANTGKELWKHSYVCSAKDPNGYSGPRCTPTVDGDRVYSLSRRGHFFCFDAATGKVIWSKEFPKDYSAKTPTWGYAGSPLIEKEMVITEVGGPGASVVAFNKKDGTEIWKAGDDAVAYSSIVAFDHDGQRCLAAFNAVGIVGRSAKDGKELWRHPWKTSYDVNAATPIIIGDKVFISSDYDRGCALIQFSGAQPKVLWENKKMRNHNATCILYQDHLYGFDNSALKCLDLTTGEPKWEEGKYGKGCTFLADGKFIIYSQTGRVATAELSPSGCKEISGFQVLGGKDTWAIPVLANGKLYCRSAKDLVCLDVKAP